MGSAGTHGWATRPISYRDQAIGELRRLGRRVSADGTGRLSPREREVAQLVAGGATNRLVADELVLSVRTAERHMENIFRKLGVRTRAGVAAAVARELVTHRD